MQIKEVEHGMNPWCWEVFDKIASAAGKSRGLLITELRLKKLVGADSLWMLMHTLEWSRQCGVLVYRRNNGALLIQLTSKKSDAV